MKLYIPFILIFLVYSTSCKKNDEPLTVYNQNVYIEMWEKNKELNVKVIDTNCINQRKRAKSDIEKGKLIYYHTDVWYEWKEMAELLNKHNIEFRDYSHNCWGPPPGFENSCYEKEMWNEINSRLGLKAVDSLWEVALRNFVVKNPNTEYIIDGIDVRTKYLSK